jgi:hypothetical protein
MATPWRRSGSLAVMAAVIVGVMVPLATSAGAATGKPGPQVAGVGIGSKAALAQDTCTAATKRTSFVAVGTGPFCVNPWPEGKNNGGATAPGVTKDSVKVVVYYGNEAMMDAERGAGGQLPKNQVTGENGTWPDSFKDFDVVFQYAIEKFGTYQTWGRKPVYEFVEATGSDEAAQRADAVKVKAMKPFIVIDASNQNAGAPVFEAELANARIIVNGAGASALTAEQLGKQAPYRWATQSDSTAAVYLVTSFLSNSLSGRPAKWAGDSALASKKRAFGLITPQGRIDVPLFNSLMKKYGGSPAAEAVTYDPTATSAEVDEVAKTLIAKLQSKGVTSVVLFANNTSAKSFTTAATSNNFNPEWIVTGYQFQDFDGFGRTYDQAQMRHAFGLGVLTPRPTVDPNVPAPLGQFEWYWGKTQGTTAPTTIGWMSFIYGAMQYAGPKLTADNVKKGLFSVPAVGGASDGTVSFQTGYGRSVGLPYDEYLGLGTDVEMIWWNADLQTNGSNAVATFPGKGRFMYLNGGKRFSFGQFPKSEPKFFDESASLYEFPQAAAYATGKVPASNPCTGCPSQGGAGA